MTRQERIQFAVRFARMNLSLNRPGDWLNLRDDLKRFLALDQPVGGSDTCFLKFHIFEKEITSAAESKLQKIQEDVMFMLLCFSKVPVDGEPVYMSFSIHSVLGVTRKKDDAGKLYSSGHVSAPLGDSVLLLLFHLCLSSPYSGVEICPECRNLFYRKGKMKFCGRTCTNRAMTKAKRTRDAKKLSRSRPKLSKHVSRKGRK